MKIKQLEWDDPVTYEASSGPYGPAYGGKSWRAHTPWDCEYEINSFDKPEGTVYYTSWGIEKIGREAKYLSVAMTIAQLDHERRIMECLG